MFIFIICVNR